MTLPVHFLEISKSAADHSAFSQESLESNSCQSLEEGVSKTRKQIR